MESDGVDDTTKRAARCCHADGQSSPGRKVAGNDGNAHDEQRTRSYAYADALSENQLPVGRTETCHHESKDDEEGPAKDQRATVADVEKGTGEHGRCADEECIDAADPRDCAIACRREQYNAVILLIHAESVKQACGLRSARMLEANVTRLLQRNSPHEFMKMKNPHATCSHDAPTDGDETSAGGGRGMGVGEAERRV